MEGAGDARRQIYPVLVPRRRLGIHHRIKASEAIRASRDGNTKKNLADTGCLSDSVHSTRCVVENPARLGYDITVNYRVRRRHCTVDEHTTYRGIGTRHWTATGITRSTRTVRITNFVVMEQG